MMPVPFAGYLAAKFALDERSLNAQVLADFLRVLRDLPRIDCLDVGAGTGATFRRFLNSGLAAPLRVTALDNDGSLLDIARQDADGWLRAQGFEPRVQDGEILGRGEPFASMRFVVSELNHYCPDRLYNVVTAHAFLDLVPLAQALRHFTAWMEPGGYLYATINYDGHTALAPSYPDTQFESRLLSHYNESMEVRRVNGDATGGAFCGRRLQALLPRQGFDIVACGRSDWSMKPIDGGYLDGDETCLEVMLDFIAGEGRRSSLFRFAELERWRDDRLQLLRERRLAMRVTHLDLLARHRSR